MALRRTVCGVENLTTIEASTPVWDTRSRRPSSSEQSTSSGFSSCSSPEGQVAAKTGSDSYFDHVQRRTMAESSVASSQSAHAPKVTAPAHGELPACWRLPPSRSKVKVYIRVKGQSDETCLRQIYQPIVDMIDPEADLIDFIDDVTMDGGKWPLVLFGGCTDPSRRVRSDVLMTPSLAVVALIREPDVVGSGRLERATRYFRKPPWRFHHSEWVAAHRIRACPQNSLDYFSVADQLPVCSVRQVHGAGGEHLRLQRYVSHENWPDSVNLYRLIVGRPPDCSRPDFCVFTVERRRSYTVQLALKRLPSGVAVSLPGHAALNFRVSDACALAPLLPHACRKLADGRWHTTDLDGNELFLEVAPARRRHRQRSRSRTRSRRSGSSTSSFASVLFDTANEFIEAEETSSAASVFSEPYVYRRRDDLGLDESCSSSVARSVLGVEASRGRNGPASAQLAPSGSDDDARDELAPGGVGDITDIRATPGHRRFAWVSEMMEADWPIAGTAAPSSGGRAPTADVSNRGHCHQHTDSGFADDKSDDSEKTNHVGCGQRRRNACPDRRNEDNASCACHDEDSCPQANSADNTEDCLDSCDREIERLRLHQSDPDVSGTSGSAGVRPGFRPHYATCRTAGDVPLPNRMSLAPPYSQNGHVTADVENVRATSCTPRLLVSPGFGRSVPPRCTSTPLVHTPAFRSVSVDPDDLQERVPSRNQLGRTQLREENRSNPGNRERDQFRQERIACDRQRDSSGSRQERPSSVNQFSSTHPDRQSRANYAKSNNRDGPASGSQFNPGVREPAKSAQICAERRREDSARPRDRHKPGLPPLPKPRRGSATNGGNPDKTRRGTDDSNTSAFVAVPSNGSSRCHGDVNNSREVRVMAEIHRVDSRPGKAEVGIQNGDLTARSGTDLTDPETGFEEAAIDCPPSLERRCPSTDVSGVSANRGTAFGGGQRPLAVSRNSGPSPPLDARNGSMTSLPRSRSVSKMVTFAEEVQEKDISICMDDVSEASPRESGDDPATMGFWI